MFDNVIIQWLIKQWDGHQRLIFFRLLYKNFNVQQVQVRGNVSSAPSSRAYFSWWVNGSSAPTSRAQFSWWMNGSSVRRDTITRLRLALEIVCIPLRGHLSPSIADNKGYEASGGTLASSSGHGMSLVWHHPLSKSCGVLVLLIPINLSENNGIKYNKRMKYKMNSWNRWTDSLMAGLSRIGQRPLMSL